MFVCFSEAKNRMILLIIEKMEIITIDIRFEVAPLRENGKANQLKMNNPKKEFLFLSLTDEWYLLEYLYIKSSSYLKEQRSIK